MRKKQKRGGGVMGRKKQLFFCDFKGGSSCKICVLYNDGKSAEE